MCSPVAHACISFGLALFTFMVKWKSWSTTFPAPPPPPLECAPLFVSPQLNDWISISPLCFESPLSPSMPSIFRKKSTAAMSGPSVRGRGAAGSGGLGQVRRRPPVTGKAHTRSMQFRGGGGQDSAVFRPRAGSAGPELLGHHPQGDVQRFELEVRPHVGDGLVHPRLAGHVLH